MAMPASMFSVCGSSPRNRRRSQSSSKSSDSRHIRYSSRLETLMLSGSIGLFLPWQRNADLSCLVVHQAQFAHSLVGKSDDLRASLADVGQKLVNHVRAVALVDDNHPIVHSVARFLLVSGRGVEPILDGRNYVREKCGVVY